MVMTADKADLLVRPFCDQCNNGGSGVELNKNGNGDDPFSSTVYYSIF